AAKGEEAVGRFRLQPEGPLLTGEELHDLAGFMIKKAPGGGWPWRFDWRAFGFASPPVWPTLGKISVPALVMRGEKSEVMPKKDFDRVVKELKGSKGITLKKAHHHVTLDDAAGTADAMAAFLASCASAA